MIYSAHHAISQPEPLNGAAIPYSTARRSKALRVFLAAALALAFTPIAGCKSEEPLDNKTEETPAKTEPAAAQPTSASEDPGGNANAVTLERNDTSDIDAALLAQYEEAEKAGVRFEEIADDGSVTVDMTLHNAEDPVEAGDLAVTVLAPDGTRQDLPNAQVKTDGEGNASLTLDVAQLDDVVNADQAESDDGAEDSGLVKPTGKAYFCYTTNEWYTFYTGGMSAVKWNRAFAKSKKRGRTFDYDADMPFIAWHNDSASPKWESVYMSTTGAKSLVARSAGNRSLHSEIAMFYPDIPRYILTSVSLDLKPAAQPKNNNIWRSDTFDRTSDSVMEFKENMVHFDGYINSWAFKKSEKVSKSSTDMADMAVIAKVILK